MDRQGAASDRDEAADELLLAHRDKLTGALVRSAGLDQMYQEVERARRTAGSVIFAFVDVDDLKGVNDGQGHAAGDSLLREVGHALRHGPRSYDIVSCWGGDEFVCALPGSLLPEAEQRMAKIGEALSEAFLQSMSFGVAELRADDTLDQVIANADRDMYARRRDRGRLDLVSAKGNSLSTSSGTASRGSNGNGRAPRSAPDAEGRPGRRADDAVSGETAGGN